MNNRDKVRQVRAVGKRISHGWSRRSEFIAEVSRAFREGPSRFRETDSTNKRVILAVAMMTIVIITMVVI
jgi:hypothetical protein